MRFPEVLKKQNMEIKEVNKKGSEIFWGDKKNHVEFP